MPAENEVMYLIPESVVIALGEYLSNKPWKEVAKVMPILQSLEVSCPEVPAGGEAHD